MKTLSVKYTIQLPTKAALPIKWVPDTITDNLKSGEGVDNWDFKPVTANITDISFDLTLSDDSTTEWLSTSISGQLSPEDGEELLDWQVVDMAA